MNEVEAVKTREEILAVSKLLSKFGSDDIADIWNIGLNLALRISDLLSVKYDDIDSKKNAITIEE